MAVADCRQKNRPSSLICSERVVFLLPYTRENPMQNMGLREMEFTPLGYVHQPEPNWKGQSTPREFTPLGYVHQPEPTIRGSSARTEFTPLGYVHQPEQ